MWTGYLFEELSSEQKAILDYVDVLIDGRFIKALADPSLLFRGSSNQRIIDIPNNRLWQAPVSPSLRGR